MLGLCCSNIGGKGSDFTGLWGGFNNRSFILSPLSSSLLAPPSSLLPPQNPFRNIPTSRLLRSTGGGARWAGRLSSSPEIPNWIFGLLGEWEQRSQQRGEGGASYLQPSGLHLSTSLVYCSNSFMSSFTSGSYEGTCMPGGPCPPGRLYFNE